MSRINIEVLPRVRQKIKESLLAKTERERRSWSWFLERNVAGRKFIANTLATRGVMIPGLESIPESDFEHFSKFYDSNSNSSYGKKNIFVQTWDMKRRPYPQSELY